MATAVAKDGSLISIPPWVTDIHSFRRWSDSDFFPQDANTWWLRGEVWVDMSREQLYTHLDIKGEVFSVLKAIVRETRSGRVFPDGLLVTNFAADISGNPDATFVSHESLQSGAARQIEAKGKDGGPVEIQGSPDMVLEVVSVSSVQKDTEVLRDAYWQAGVKEYWLVDARMDPVNFEILRRGARGFASSRKQDGWLKSNVFGKSFRFVQTVDESENPEFILEVR